MIRKNEKTLLIKNASCVFTVKNKSKILKNVSILIKDNVIQAITKKNTKADRVIDASGMIVLPGFINCHHHMFQCGMRGMPSLQNKPIESWIQTVCLYSKRIDEELMYYLALANMSELLLYGTTTTTDMHYIFPKENHRLLIEATIRAAHDIGIRFHPYRGSISLSKKDGALFPDNLVEDSDNIAIQSEKLIRKYHDNRPFSMVRVGLAPCTIFSNRDQDFSNALDLSKKYDINLQTHLSESEFENKYSLNKFHKRPADYLYDLGWSGKKISFVHAININRIEMKQLSETKTNIVYCPISNARAPIGEVGIAPIWEMLEKNINIGIGVDGSAGNDSSNMLEELRWARTIQGARKESTYLEPHKVIKMGTLGGAKLLNWSNEIGSIEVGKAADIAIFDLTNKIEFVGSQDIETALLSCQATRAKYVLVNGQIVVSDNRLTFMNEKNIITKLHKKLKRLRN